MAMAMTVTLIMIILMTVIMIAFVVEGTIDFFIHNVCILEHLVQLILVIREFRRVVFLRPHIHLCLDS